MRLQLLGGLAAMATLALTPTARAAFVVNFDDVTTAQVDSIPSGYSGLSWDGIGVFKASDFPGNGYFQALASGDYVAYSQDQPVSTISGSSPFALNSGYFSSGFNDGLVIEVAGLRLGNVLFSTNLTLNTTGQTFATFNYQSIDEVRFTVVSPGTMASNLPYGGFGTHFGIDNLTFGDAVTTTAAPAPGGLVLGCLGGLSLLGSRLRRRAT